MLRRSLERSRQLELKKRCSWGGASATPAAWGGALPAAWGGASPAAWGGPSPAVIAGVGGREGEFRAVPALQGPRAGGRLWAQPAGGWGMLGTNLQIPFPDVLFQTAKFPMYVFLVKGICILLLAGSSWYNNWAMR